MGAVLFRSPEQEQIKEMRVALLFGGILAFMLVTEAVGKCTERRKCGLGRGTCNSNSQCRGRLVCGRNNCKSFNKNAKSTANCCTSIQEPWSVQQKGSLWCGTRSLQKQKGLPKGTCL